MTLRLHLVDAFATTPFTGNPAAVVLLDAPRPDDWMQQVAMEMNQAETAFVEAERADVPLRWFTPRREVDLCGHATLAAAHVLWNTGRLPPDAQARFSTRSGILTAARRADQQITLNFPAILSRTAIPPADLDEALGVRPDHVLRGEYDLMCVMPDAASVYKLRPDLQAIAAWETRGLIVTARSDRNDADFISRCFYPALGVPEDPVTGSAHCALAVYWGEQLHRSSLTGWQASTRGGHVGCGVYGDRVALTGGAVTVLEADLQV